MKKQGGLIFVLALLGSVAVAGPGSADSGEAASVSEPDANESVSLDDDPNARNDWDEVRIALPHIERKMEAVFGARYAGKWLQAGSPSVMTIRLQDPLPTDEASLSALTGDYRSRFALVAAKYSGAQLRVYEALARNELLEREPRVITAIGNDPETNTVEVHVEEATNELRNRLLARGLPPDSFRLVSGFRPGSLVHTTREQYPPHEGALRAVVVPQGSQYGSGCTTAWTVRHNTNGNYYGLTAGHCGDVGDGVYIGGQFVSNISSSTFDPFGSNLTDSARYYVSPSDAKARIMRSFDQHRTVTSPKWEYADMAEGIEMCFIGQASAAETVENVGSCGTVNLVGTVGLITGGELRNAICFDVPAVGGDSGAPIFSRAPGIAYPAGIVASTGYIEGAHSVCGTMVGAAGGSHNVRLIFG